MVRALARIARGVGLRHTWSHTFPGIPGVSKINSFIYLIQKVCFRFYFYFCFENIMFLMKI